MKELQDRIVAYVTASNGFVSLEKLLTVSMAKGFSEGEVLQALSSIGKKLKSTVRANQVYYQVALPPKTPVDHLKWVRDNYIRPHHCEHQMEYTDCESCKPWPQWDLSWMFLKTKEERDAFLVEMKGRQAVYNKKRYEKAK